MNISVPTICALSKQNSFQIIHQHFGHVYIARLKRVPRKGLMEGLPTNTHDLEEPFPIFLLTKATTTTRGPKMYASNFLLGFMIQMDFVFFNDESIREFTLTFVAICSANSYQFGFPSIRKLPHLYILKCIVTTFE